jgi:hypothetical protein
VIPVLFIASTLQARQLQPLLAAVHRLQQRKRGHLTFRWLAVFLAAGLPAAIVIAGGAGELIALFALYSGSEAGDQRPVTLTCTTILVVTVVGGTFISAISRAAKGVPPLREAPGEDEAAGD